MAKDKPPCRVLCHLLMSSFVSLELFLEDEDTRGVF